MDKVDTLRRRRERRCGEEEETLQANSAGRDVEETLQAEALQAEKLQANS